MTRRGLALRCLGCVAILVAPVLLLQVIAPANGVVLFVLILGVAIILHLPVTRSRS